MTFRNIIQRRVHIDIIHDIEQIESRGEGCDRASTNKNHLKLFIICVINGDHVIATEYLYPAAM